MTKIINKRALTIFGVVIAAVTFLCPSARADEALILKYSGGRLVFAGVGENIQFTPGQGFLSTDSQIFAFRDKCSGQYVRVIDDFIIKLSKDQINCNDLPR